MTTCIDCNGLAVFVVELDGVEVARNPCHCVPKPGEKPAATVVVNEPGAWQLIGDVDCAVGE